MSNIKIGTCVRLISDPADLITGIFHTGIVIANLENNDNRILFTYPVVYLDDRYTAELQTLNMENEIL